MGVNKFADKYYKYIDMLSALHFSPLHTKEAKLKRIQYIETKISDIDLCYIQVKKFSKKDLLIKKNATI